ncbi:hypothetical protein ABEB36_014471 [Hypothenemus hampei]|uniref:Uncharacterized protein n=1 Tax=Hypothenemus hampei TaxID=57062 RepID=A0ABD1E2S6_HYPHA
MSADSFHHQVEMQLKRKRKVYDFNDFIVQNANKKGYVKEMKIEDFKNWVDLSSQYKLNKIVPRPLLQNMVHMIFERGQRTKLQARGVTKARKKNLLAKLVSILPKNRLAFWENLPINEDVEENIEGDDGISET